MIKKKLVLKTFIAVALTATAINIQPDLKTIFAMEDAPLQTPSFQINSNLQELKEEINKTKYDIIASIKLCSFILQESFDNKNYYKSYKSFLSNILNPTYDSIIKNIDNLFRLKLYDYNKKVANSFTEITNLSKSIKNLINYKLNDKKTDFEIKNIIEQAKTENKNILSKIVDIDVQITTEENKINVNKSDTDMTKETKKDEVAAPITFFNKKETFTNNNVSEKSNNVSEKSDRTEEMSTLDPAVPSINNKKELDGLESIIYNAQNILLEIDNFEILIDENDRNADRKNINYKEFLKKVKQTIAKITLTTNSKIFNYDTKLAIKDYLSRTKELLNIQEITSLNLKNLRHYIEKIIILITKKAQDIVKIDNNLKYEIFENVIKEKTGPVYDPSDADNIIQTLGPILKNYEQKISNYISVYVKNLNNFNFDSKTETNNNAKKLLSNTNYLVNRTIELYKNSSKYAKDKIANKIAENIEHLEKISTIINELKKTENISEIQKFKDFIKTKDIKVLI